MSETTTPVALILEQHQKLSPKEFTKWLITNSTMLLEHEGKVIVLPKK